MDTEDASVLASQEFDPKPFKMGYLLIDKEWTGEMIWEVKEGYEAASVISSSDKVGELAYELKNPRNNVEDTTVKLSLALKSVILIDISSSDYENPRGLSEEHIEVLSDDTGPAKDQFQDGKLVVSTSSSADGVDDCNYCSHFTPAGFQKMEFYYELAFEMDRSDDVHLYEYYENPVFAFKVVMMNYHNPSDEVY